MKSSEGLVFTNVPVQLLEYIFKPKWREHELAFTFFLYARKYTDCGCITDKKTFIQNASKDFKRSSKSIQRRIDKLIEVNLIREKKGNLYLASLDTFANLLQYKPEEHQAKHKNGKTKFVCVAIPQKQYCLNPKKCLYDLILYRNQCQQSKQIENNVLQSLPVTNAQCQKILRKYKVKKKDFIQVLISAISSNSLHINHEVAQMFGLNQNNIDKIYNSSQVKQVMSCIGFSKKINRKSASTASRQFKKLEVTRSANIVDTGMTISSRKELYEIREFYGSHCYLFTNHEGKVFQKLASFFYSNLKNVMFRIPKDIVSDIS